MDNPLFPIAVFEHEHEQEHEHEFPAIAKNPKNCNKPLAENSVVSVAHPPRLSSLAIGQLPT